MAATRGRRIALTLLAIGVAAFGASAAEAGSIAISLTIPPLAQISGLTDVSFSSVGVTADAVNSQNVCAFSNTATRAYTVTATGSGSGSAFTLATTGGLTVPYSVGWAGSAGSATTTGLAVATPSAAFTGGALLPGCTIGSASTATLQVTITAAKLQTMTSGASYTGTLTLVITPS